jgi:hypothetical protein
MGTIADVPGLCPGYAVSWMLALAAKNQTRDLKGVLDSGAPLVIMRLDLRRTNENL